jgi:hypothetical protein
MRWYAVLTGLVVAAGLAGCGGSDGPTAEQRRAAKARWVQRVDAACEKANQAIAERGWPVDLVDLDRLVVRGIDDARVAIRTITRERLPKGSGPRPGAFVREMKALDPELTKLSEASEDLDPSALVKAAEALKPRLVEVEKSAKAAGLSDCLSHDERMFIPDAVRAPVFAEQLAKLDRTLLRKVKSVRFAQASTPGEFAQAFKRYSELVDTAVEGIDRLDPPLWAAKQTGKYQVALRELQAVSQKYTAVLVGNRGKPVTREHIATYMRLDKELNKAGRREIKTRRKMLRAVGAGPTTRLGPRDEGGAVEPESEEQS